MITIIGDVHGKYDEYFSIVSKVGYSICLGDFGFSSAWNKLNYSDLDPNRHKVCTGNHCDYDMAPNSPFYLGDYGMTNVGGLDFFFVRGGISIDRVYREVDYINKGPKTYWHQEELNFEQMANCLNLYKKLKPDIVLTHVPPNRFVKEMTRPRGDYSTLVKFGFPKDFKENTGLLGNMMLDSHKPKLWLSGHMHLSYIFEEGNFKFIALSELETYEINL